MKGLKPGEKFHLYSLEKVEEKESKSQQPFTKSPIVEKVSETELNNVKEEFSLQNTSSVKDSTPSKQHSNSTHISYTQENEEFTSES